MSRNSNRFLSESAVSLLRRHTFVVIGGDHRNPLNIVRSLGMCGIFPEVILIGEDSHLVAASRYVRRLVFAQTQTVALEKLIEIYSHLPEKVFVLTGEDKMTEYLNRNKDKLQNFYFFSVAHGPAPTFYFEKQNQNNLALACGLLVPKSVIWHKGDPLDIIDDSLFPVFIKAANSLAEDWKGAACICDTKQELAEHLMDIPFEEILIQKYLQKTNELAIQGYSTQNGATIGYTISTKYNYLVPDNYSHFVEASPCTDLEVTANISSMLQAMGFNGIFEAEFLVDQNNQLWFLEINLRCTALLYLSNQAGMPPAVMWALSTLGYSAETPLSSARLPLCGISEFDDLRVCVLTKRIPLSSWFRDLRNCQCFCYYNKYDKGPFFQELRHILSKKVKRFLPTV